MQRNCWHCLRLQASERMNRPLLSDLTDEQLTALIDHREGKAQARAAEDDHRALATAYDDPARHQAAESRRVPQLAVAIPTSGGRPDPKAEQ